MNPRILLFLAFFILHHFSFGQAAANKMVYVIDSIPVIEDPEDGNEIVQTDISELTVIKNKDSLKLLGYEKFDGVIFIFTKEYRNRPDKLKQILSSKKLQRKNGGWYFQDKLYSGPFIDYYYSGKIQGEGTFLNGALDGSRTLYYTNGKHATERNYTNGIANGLEKEFYEDGSLKQKGEYVNGKEEGIWDTYFPNGQLKQRSNLKNGIIDGETTVYYSTGKILAVELTINGKTIPDKHLEKVNKAMNKGHENSKDGDYGKAIKNYSLAIELDSSYADAYFSRATVKLNDFQFDAAIADFDKALSLEPFMKEALSNRAFARIRKYQFANSRTLSKNSEVTVLASKDKTPVPEIEKEKICDDLKKAILLGDKSKMILDAKTDYCQTR